MEKSRDLAGQCNEFKTNFLDKPSICPSFLWTKITLRTYYKHDLYVRGFSNLLMQINSIAIGCFEVGIAFSMKASINTLSTYVCIFYSPVFS